LIKTLTFITRFYFQYKNHKFYKRGFLSIALMLADIDDDDIEKINAFDELIATVNKQCGKVEIPDRCENAVEVAKCLDRILEIGNVEKNMVFSESNDLSN
jgi:hypothetical protein